MLYKKRLVFKSLIFVMLIICLFMNIALAQDDDGKLYLPIVSSSGAPQSPDNIDDNSLPDEVYAAAVQPFGVWSRRAPSTTITYRFDSTFSSKGTAWTDAANLAAADWSALTISLVYNASSPNVLKVAELGGTTLGRLDPTLSGAYMSSFVLTIDPTPGPYTWFVGSGTITSSQVDLKTILRHEFGHALGIAHNNSSGTLMYSFTAPGTSLMVGANDRNAVKYLYDPTYTGTPDPVLSVYSTTAAGTYDDTSTTGSPVLGRVGYGGASNWVSNSGFTKAYNTTVNYTSGAVGARYWVVFQGSTITRQYTMAINRSGVEIFIDGVSQGTMNDFASTPHWQAAKTWEDSTGVPHIIEFRKTGSANFIDVDAFTINTAHSATGTYNMPGGGANTVVGSWTLYTGTGPYNNDVIYSKNTDDAIVFTFKGTSIKYFYTKAFNRGKAHVVIDGVDKGTIDLYSATIQWQSSTTYSGLPNGFHTIHIAATGTTSGSDYYVDVDKFEVN